MKPDISPHVLLPPKMTVLQPAQRLEGDPRQRFHGGLRDNRRLLSVGTRVQHQRGRSH